MANFKYYSRLILLLLLFINNIITAQDPTKKIAFENPRQKSLTIPFKFVYNMIIIKVQINDSSPLHFILDTGLTTTLLTELGPGDSINLNYAREIQLVGLGKGEPLIGMHSYGNEIKIQGIVGQNHDMYIVTENIFNLSARLGLPINGILGYQIFSNFIVKIDYSRNKITFYDPEHYDFDQKTKGYSTIPLKIHETKPYIDAIITDHKGVKTNMKLLFDTGATQTLWIDPKTVPGFTIPEVLQPVMLGYGLNGEVTGKIGRVESINIGDFTLNNPIIAIPDSASIAYAPEMGFRNGSLGSEIIKRFNLIINYPENKVKMRPNSHFNKHFTQNLSGLEIISPHFYLPIYVIDYVRDDSPAMIAGAMVGDEILSINSMELKNLTLEQVYEMLQSRPGRKIFMRLNRNNTIVKISFRLEEYI
jgi:hypothetical protein